MYTHKTVRFFLAQFTLACALTGISWAEGSLLVDQNGDGSVSYLAFGDSITFGLGDGAAPGVTVYPLPFSGGGYPNRISKALGIKVINSGISGEFFSQEGIQRLPSAINKTSVDLVSVFEGANDGFIHESSDDYAIKMQKAVNVIVALGRQPILATLPTPCCEHAGLAPFADSYSSAVVNIGALNQVPVVDLKRAWRTTCEGGEECDLFNLPEGQHPNTRGYDVISQTFLATLYGIDIFSVDGAKQLEDALGQPAGTVIVRPGA